MKKYNKKNSVTGYAPLHKNNHGFTPEEVKAEAPKVYKLEEIISKAIEGGWTFFDHIDKPLFSWEYSGVVNPQGKGIDNEMQRHIFDVSFAIKNEKDISKCQREFYLSEIVLDKTFWQSLGNAMGWKEKEISHGNWDDMKTMTYKSKKEWSYHWHRFIDQIIEGKSIEDFFKELK